MSDNSAIEWTQASWNPVTGCTKVSPGCDHCYAETFAERFRGVPGHHFENGFDVQIREDKLTLPLRWRKPRRIFVNSMSDLFHDAIPDEYIARVFAVMATTPHHTYQLLTKRHARMRSLLADGGQRLLEATTDERTAEALYEQWPLPNVWLGVSVENQQWTDIRVPALLATPAAVRWLSCEPLLGPVDLTAIRHQGRRTWAVDDTRETRPIDWVVVGGESGPGARPMHPDWARSLRDQCTRAETSYFFKQWGNWHPASTPIVLNDRTWTLKRCGTTDQTWTFRRGDKNHRDLDGRTWDEYPTVTAEAVAA